MTQDSSVLGRLRARSGGSVDRGMREDEWYIPYKAPTGGIPPHSGIGFSPVPVRQSTTNFFGVFASSSHKPAVGDLNRNYRFPSGAPSAKPTLNYSKILTQYARSPSYDSLISHIPIAARIPSSSSVPTGLVAPKLLFSPLSREIRASHSIKRDSRDDEPPRQRTVSLPRPSRSNPYDSRREERRWAVPNMCDMFVLPRPHIMPHLITPPVTPDEKGPEEPRVIEEGKARQKEREEWAELVKRRGRSMSFGSQVPPAGGPIIGNARARSRENSRSESMSKTDVRLGRHRSGSIGSARTSRQGSGRHKSRGHRKRGVFNSDTSQQFVPVVPSRRSSLPHAGVVDDANHPRGGDLDEDDPFHSRRRSEQAEYRESHSQMRSSPEVLASFGSYKLTQDPPPTQRSLRIQQPPSVDKWGVVVIGAGPFEPHQPDSRVRHPKPPHLELTKPLPPLPSETSLPVPSPRPNIASPRPTIASPPSTGTAMFEPVSTPRMSSVASSSNSALQATFAGSNASEPNSPNVRAVLAKQHQRALTKRAFQAPPHSTTTAYSPRSSQETPRSAASATFPVSAGTLASSTAASSTMLTTPIPRRMTAMEEAIGRSRAASVGSLEGKESNPTKPNLRVRPRTAGEDGSDGGAPILRVTPVEADPHTPTSPSFVPSPELAYPIVTDATPRPAYSPDLQASASTSFLAVNRPNLVHADSNMTTRTKYSDASEGWDRSGAGTPSPLSDRRHLEATPLGPSPSTTIDDRDFHVSVSRISCFA